MIAKILLFTAKDLLIKASEPVVNGELIGGTTSVIGMITNKNILNIANMGDSAMLIFRNFSYDNRLKQNGPYLYFQTAKQVVAFNAPLHIGNIRSMKEEGSSASDVSLWCESYQIPVVPGDIIIATTDGLTDNLFPTEIQYIVRQIWNNKPGDSQRICDYLLKSAIDKQNQSPDTVTPFGCPKPDDTTIVVGIVE